MTTWLLSIVGITIIGVLVELILTDSPLAKFTRSIFGFFLLLVIVQPIPGFFRNMQHNLEHGEIPINTDLVNEINRQTGEARATAAVQALSRNGFNDTIVIFFDGRFFVNAYNSTNRDKQRIIDIVTAVTGANSSAVEVFM